MELPFQTDLANVLRDNNREQEPMRWSNFLITVNTNVKPDNLMQGVALTEWLMESCEELFSDFDSMNGRVLKPAGAPNDEFPKFENNHKISGVSTRVTVEMGAQKGLVHAHILLEICHHYDQKNKYGYAGVHINRTLLHDFFKSRIEFVRLPDGKKPKSVYIDSKVLTTSTDNSNKFLTLHYLNKDRARDNGDPIGAKSLNLRAQYASASDKNQKIHDSMANDNNVIFENEN